MALSVLESLTLRQPYSNPTLVVVSFTVVNSGYTHHSPKWANTIVAQRMQHPWYSSMFTLSNTLSVYEYGIPGTPHVANTDSLWE